MLMHHWSVGLVRLYALQALEEELRQRHGAPRREPARRLRKAFGRGLSAAGRLLSRMGERLAGQAPGEPRPLGCG
ncbi:MAG TPA: hypothetical protein VFA23_05000 [Dongiaceae bacterium]|nr:hypothetical protein [Dongiaceae bacterium]